MSLTADMVSGYDANVLGGQTVTVTYNGKSAFFTVTIKAAGGGGGGGGGGGSIAEPEPDEEDIVELPDGTKAVVITEQEVQKLLSKTDEGETAVIDLGEMEEENAVKIVIPGSAAAGNLGSSVRITTPAGIITVDLDELRDLGLSSGGQVEIIVRPAEGSGEILIDGKKVDPTGLNNPLEMSVSYTPQPGQNTDLIVAYTVDENGNKIIIPMSRYEDGMVYFTPVSSGSVSIMYDDVVFNDTVGHWMDEDVCYLAARGIVTGTGNKMFTPQANVKRADFVVMLVRLMGIPAAGGENFADVKPGSYYEAELAAAKALGIISGIGENMFDPEGEISRQDMFVMLYRALQAYAEFQWTEGAAKQFKDYSEVSAYALDSMDSFVQAGMIQGDNGYLRPASTATRAEAATVLRNMINYLSR